MSQRATAEIAPFNSIKGRNSHPAVGNLFEQQFIQQLLLAFRPEIKALIKEAIADQIGLPLVVDYEEAGRLIGTIYEGVRKLVRKGKLQADSRSGRYRGIAVQELKDYVQRSQVTEEWPTFVCSFGSEQS